jgi:hypothetical protein
MPFLFKQNNYKFSGKLSEKGNDDFAEPNSQKKSTVSESIHSPKLLFEKIRKAKASVRKMLNLPKKIVNSEPNDQGTKNSILQAESTKSVNYAKHLANLNSPISGTLISPVDKTSFETLAEENKKVKSYIEAKISNKYIITTYVHGISKNGELSEDDSLEKISNAKEVVIGDLHGDIKKLIEHLILSGMISLSENHLDKFYRITENGNTNGNFANYRKMTELSSILSRVVWIGGIRELKLIGDVLSDRSGNDLVMIRFINDLRKKGARITIFTGNHDHNAFLPNSGVLKQATSMINARASSGFGSQSDYLSYPPIQKEYLQYARDIKVLEFNPLTETLITHAPIYETSFKQWHSIMIQNKLIRQVDYNQLNIQDFVKGFNHLYRLYLKELVLTGCTNQKMEKYLMIEETSFLFSRNGGQDGQSNDLPTFNGQIKVLVNGHNTCPNSPTSSKGLVGNENFVNICLDNSAGKSDDSKIVYSPIYLIR